MSRLAIAIAGLIFIALIGVVTFSYLKLSHFEDSIASAYNQNNLSLSDGSGGINNLNTQKSFNNDSWTSSLSQGDQGNYMYPALELDISFDIDSLEKRQKQFRVIVEELDSYKFFCLNQVLTSNGMNYAFYRNGKGIQLMVSAKSEEYLNAVLEQLKHYEIKYQVDKT